MAIEGPLRELGIHDVFQLLDLSRKTGALTVTSALRDNQGTVYFDRGAVVHATIRSNPHRLGAMLLRAGKISEGDLARAQAEQERAGEGRRFGEILVELGAVSWPELERQVRFQVEEVVFELMSWRDGFFSFEERTVTDTPAEASIRISTESLLMEGARRIDEWAHIERRVPHVGVVPALAPASDDHPSLLDLRPSEWEVLSEIDGTRDLRSIADALGRSDFEVAKVAYGLSSTGVIELHDPRDQPPSADNPDAPDHLRRVSDALRAGRLADAESAARLALAADPHSPVARLALGRALGRLGRHDESADQLRRAAQMDASNAAIRLEVAYWAARRGDLAEAIGNWERYLGMVPDAPDVSRVQAAIVAASRLRELLDMHARHEHPLEEPSYV